MAITIILGAGASKASSTHYPLLNKMLSEIFNYANKPKEAEKFIAPQYITKQRLLLTYSVKKALNQPVIALEQENISQETINNYFSQIFKKIINEKITISEIFKKLDDHAITDESATKAHWALTHAISVYMLQLYIINSLGNSNQAFISLLSLIEKFFNSNISINIIDFNYDCLLERYRYEYQGSSGATFGWEIGRSRLVLSSAIKNNLTNIINSQIFIEPLDGDNFIKKVNLIKPHGDLCTFLNGTNGIYYTGGRHSQATTALFPEKLSDISETDNYLRSSIMPPTNSRRRHSSSFYEDELSKLKLALLKSSLFIIIGWSAKGTDNFYNDLFSDALTKNSKNKRLFIIDRAQGGDQRNLVNRFCKLFCMSSDQINFNYDGFTKESVIKLRHILEGT